MEMLKQLKLGPDGFDKIAIIGSAPTSVQLAPYRDNSWAIWGCSPGVYGVAPRKDVWFETHRWEPQEPGFPGDPHAKGWYSPEYVRFMELFHGPVFMSERVNSIKGCTLYPFAEMLAKHGPYHFTSSIAWMIALALELKPKAIGLWGVDMAAHEEYALQRPGCQHFLGLAARMGIQVVLPPESDLLQPSTLYGISEVHPRHIKLLARQRELEGRKAAIDQQIAGLSQQSAFLTGAIDNLKYIFAHWVNDIDPMIDKMVSSSAALVARPDPLDPILDLDFDILKSVPNGRLQPGHRI